jgi:metal-dependent hydrolase (beta-lactamase superfamily II)
MRATVEFLRSIRSRWLAAPHCTGYYAERMLMETFRDQWVPGTVGARITL